MFVVVLDVDDGAYEFQRFLVLPDIVQEFRFDHGWLHILWFHADELRQLLLGEVLLLYLFEDPRNSVKELFDVLHEGDFLDILFLALLDVIFESWDVLELLHFLNNFGVELRFHQNCDFFLVQPVGLQEILRLIKADYLQRQLRVKKRV